MKNVITSAEPRNLLLPGGAQRKGKEEAADHLFRRALEGRNLVSLKDNAEETGAASVQKSGWKSIDWALAQHIERFNGHAEPPTDEAADESNEEMSALMELTILSKDRPRIAGMHQSGEQAEITATARNLHTHGEPMPGNSSEEAALPDQGRQAADASRQKIPATAAPRESSRQTIDPNTPIAAELPARQVSGDRITLAPSERLTPGKTRSRDVLTTATGSSANEELNRSTSQPTAIRGTMVPDHQMEVRVVAIQRVETQTTPPQSGEDKVGATQKSASAEPAHTTPLSPSENGRTIQTLKIQIHPAELGMVTARLRLVGEQLSVELTVETSEARHHLSSDNDSIIRALRSLGYEVDRVTVQQTPQGGNTGNGRDGGFQASGGNNGSADGQPRHMRQHSGQEPSGRHGSNSPQERDNVAQGGLYI